MTDESKPIEPVKIPAVELFKLYMPAFKQTSDVSCALYLRLAEGRIPDGALGTDTEYGRILMAAHLLTVNSAAGSEASATAGTFSGAVASKTVGSMSISYDTGGTAETDAGWWNLTPYGKQLYSLMRRHRRMPFVAYGRALEP